MSAESRGEVIDHALAKHTLASLRDVETKQVEFRKGLVKLGRICGYEIIDGRLGTEPVTVQTPLAEAQCEQVTSLDNIVIINVLRAATPFVEGLLKAFPRARQGVISASRDESNRHEDGSFPISVDYVKLPRITAEDTVIIADPMLATGSTMMAVLDHLDGVSESGANKIVLSAVSAPEGIDRVTNQHPDVDVLTVAIDEELNEEGFIVPGLGDAGDRAFRTE